MIPTYPKIRAELSRRNNLQIKRLMAEKLGVFHRAAVRAFEGDRMAIKRAGDPEIDVSNFVRIEASHQVHIDQMENVEPTEVLTNIATQMASQQAKSIISNLNSAVEKVGNIVDAKKGGFTVETFFECIEKIQIDFKGGKPILPSIVINPAMAESAKRIMDELNSSPEHGKRFDKIIEEKKRAWDARESLRKLAD